MEWSNLSGESEEMKAIETERLLLRPWRNADLDAFAEMNADLRVMEHFRSTSSREQSEAAMSHIRGHFDRHGYGFWAVEVKGGDPFIGFVGLGAVSFDAHFTPAVEIGWRLAHASWGKGYASEAARASLRFAFVEAGLDEVVSFTVPANHRSISVMERIGMHRAGADDFDHPCIPAGHPLRRHLLYRLRRSEWASAQSRGQDA
jgi:ribosomal-protein-alanine N-acetyltransferase